MNNPLDFNIKNRFFKFLLEKLTRLDVLKGWYQHWMTTRSDSDNDDGPAFLDFTLQQLDAKLHMHNEKHLTDIPATGPVVFVANHPLGGLEGMLLTQYLLKHRPDLKVLTNEMLLIFPEFKSIFIGVDVLTVNKQKNSQGIRQLNKHLAASGAVLIFPAGTVAQISLLDFSIHDHPWHPMVGRLIQKHQASCLPIYVKARNNYSFYLSGLIHKRLRTALLVRFMLNKQHSTINAYLGSAIDSAELENFSESNAATEYLRMCCESLNKNVSSQESQRLKQVDIKQDINISTIHNQLQQLQDYRLQGNASMAVYCAPYNKLGCLMEQIAICRERTFRAVDEGTGKELDSDNYDSCYWHLWVWDETKDKIIGGYRLAIADEIINQYGIKKLYSNSLYSYDKTFIKSLRHSVEVGRSFITPEYQRNPRALDLLWKGIGRFMVNNPDCHTLFGCVSISQQYSMLARSLLAETFTYHYSVDASVQKQVNARKPLAFRKQLQANPLLPALADIPIINKLLGRIDSGNSIPVLIRHYLALNGKFISFSVNEAFNQSLDGLIVVDLRNTPEKYIARYLGSDGMKAFKLKWKQQEDAA